jgi:hypothetical protein
MLDEVLKIRRVDRGQPSAATNRDRSDHAISQGA